MSELSLRECENEVERSRAKLAFDLAVLRSPATVSAFTDDLKREAFDAKDAIVDKVKSSAQSTAASFAEELKAKAAANPAATLAIGAGIAWRLFRNPPIASLLVGVGLFSLWRTQARPAAPGEQRDYVREGRERLVQQASELAETARQRAIETGVAASHAVSDKASELMDATTERLAQLGENAGTTLQQTIQQARSAAQATAVDMAAKASDAVDMASRRLRGAADQALAIGGRAIDDAGRNIRNAAVQATSLGGQAMDEAGRRLGDGADQAASYGARGVDATEATLVPSQQGANGAAANDLLLRGAANLALLAAVGLIVQKRLAERREQ
jgi:hypothetical protein